MFGIPAMNVDTKCDCGSGKDRWPEYDGYGIFLCYVCENCEQEKMNTYRSDIKEQYECDEQIEEDY